MGVILENVRLIRLEAMGPAMKGKGFGWLVFREAAPTRGC
jgi:hypothetical protein